jgi:hypothetical protein
LSEANTASNQAQPINAELDTVIAYNHNNHDNHNNHNIILYLYNNKKPNHPQVMEDVRDANVRDFMNTASEFCKLMEQASRMRTGELLLQLQQTLPMIYAKSAKLSKPKHCYEEEPKRFVNEEDYARVHDALQQKIELYFGITQMSPGTGPSQFELLSFSIAEGFTDLYEQLKNCVKLFDIGIPQAMNDAIWLYYDSFISSLGLKLIESLKSLHQLLYSRSTEGSREIRDNDFEPDKDAEEPWYSDDQEEVYGDDE